MAPEMFFVLYCILKLAQRTSGQHEGQKNELNE